MYRIKYVFKSETTSINEALTVSSPYQPVVDSPIGSANFIGHPQEEDLLKTDWKIYSIRDGADSRGPYKEVVVIPTSFE
ncbi:hypothetical protein GCM10028807_32620 [Spirosoma daeguense]